MILKFRQAFNKVKYCKLTINSNYHYYNSSRFALFVNDTLLLKDCITQIKELFLRPHANIMLNLQFLLYRRKKSSSKHHFSLNRSEQFILIKKT